MIRLTIAVRQAKRIGARKMNERIRELAAEILRLRGEPASDDEHFAFAFVRHLFLSQMQRAEKAEAALAEAKTEIAAMKEGEK